MEKKTLVKAIDDSDLCDYAWRYLDCAGDCTTEEVLAKVKKLVNQLANRILKITD